LKTHIAIPFYKAIIVFSVLFVFCASVFAQNTNNAIEEGVDLQDPPNITTKTVYNPETGNYEVHEKVGDRDYQPVRYMTLEEYMEYDTDR
jgi:hypothetical protein